MSTSVQVIPEGRLAFGIHLPVAAQSLAFVQDWERAAGPEDLVRIAQAADRLGYFHLGVSDHVAIPRALAPRMSTTWYDTVATMAFLASATQRIRLMSYVWVMPYRHPLVTAKTFATLDTLSGGRVILGVGTGHVREEFEALGIDFTRRGRLLDEGIDAVLAAWTEEFPEHEGPEYSFADVGQRPRPVQRPRPPLWVGGSSKAALRRAARVADGWLPQGPPEMGMAGAIEFLRSERRRIRGDDPIAIGSNGEWLHVTGRPPADLPAETRTGSPEALAEPFRAARALGANHTLVRLRARSVEDYLDQLEAFMVDVAPRIES